MLKVFKQSNDIPPNPKVKEFQRVFFSHCSVYRGFEDKYIWPCTSGAHLEMGRKICWAGTFGNIEAPRREILL